MYEDDALRARARASLESAQAHREAGDQPARLDALSDAVEAASTLADGPLLAAACWRLAKARYDLHLPGLVDALTPMLARDVEERGVWGIKHAVGPFDHYTSGLRALPKLSRRFWDHEGYGSDTLQGLWEAYTAWYEAREDPFLAAWGRTHLAWQFACRGELAQARSLALRYARQSPSNFGVGDHVHPRATEAETSVYWVQLDLSRTWLRGATWAGVERSAWEAREHLEDAAEDSGLERHTDFWFLDAILQARARFAWDDVPETYDAAYRGHLQADAVPPFHRARGRALTATSQGSRVEALLEAWALGEQEAPGPEWLVDVARQLARSGADAALWQSRGQSLAAETSVVWAP